MPKWSQWVAKGSVYLFAFHFGNVIRHLIWDMGYELTNRWGYKNRINRFSRHTRLRNVFTGSVNEM
ncbi:CGH_1_HP_G0103940.mRNA.1.CDS.1 [Saccharomyces cerevisiae]|nr:CGH_1_HP_G0103940.mRNA.1.CDS.1 [Saccharomyces cerevisiae]CAI6951140.1 CGH_1_HP_G0103940.mRNA.1.CDS.1 [Saccharomyces cerevisiae]